MEKKSHSQVTGRTPEKTKKNSSYTQGDIVEDVDEILENVTLKKPRSSFNFYMIEIMKKDSSMANITQATSLYGKKWKKLSSSDRAKYEEMAEEDKKRYEEDLAKVRKHVLSKPIKEGATAYRLFLENHISKAIDKDLDIKEAKKEAQETWKEMSAEEKREWNEKKKDHASYYDELKKAGTSVSSFAIFIKDKIAKAKEKGDSLTFAEIAVMWNKSKPSVKEKYQAFAEEINKERRANIDLYELAHGVQPKRPAGAYRFFLMEAAKDGKLEGKNPIKEGTKLWSKLSEEEKEKYKKIAHKAKLAYMMKKLEFKAQLKKASQGSKAMSPFNIFIAEHKGKENLPEGQSFFQYMHKKWIKLDESAKKKYIKMAEESKVEAMSIRKEIQMRVYQKPKKVGTAFSLFTKAIMPELSKEHPKLEVQDIVKHSFKKWNETSDKAKEKYFRQFEKHREEYKRKLKDFETKGFYINDKEPMKKKQSRSRTASASKSKKSKKA